MIIKFNDKVLRIGDKWVSNGFPVLNGNYLVSTSVNAVSAVRPNNDGVYYIPIPENMGEPVALPDTYTAYGNRYSERRPTSIVNYNGPDNVKNLTLYQNDDGVLSIGDNTFNHLETVTYRSSGMSSESFYVGNNSLNGASATFTTGADTTLYIGNNSCSNITVNVKARDYAYIGANSCKQIIYGYSDLTIEFGTGILGTDMSIPAILFGEVNRPAFRGNIRTSLTLSAIARGAELIESTGYLRWHSGCEPIEYTGTSSYREGEQNTINLYGISDEDISWLNGNVNALVKNGWNHNVTFKRAWND